MAGPIQTDFIGESDYRTYNFRKTKKKEVRGNIMEMLDNEVIQEQK